MDSIQFGMLNTNFHLYNQNWLCSLSGLLMLIPSQQMISLDNTQLLLTIYAKDTDIFHYVTRIAFPMKRLLYWFTSVLEYNILYIIILFNKKQLPVFSCYHGRYAYCNRLHPYFEIIPSTLRVSSKFDHTQFVFEIRTRISSILSVYIHFAFFVYLLWIFYGLK